MGIPSTVCSCITSSVSRIGSGSTMTLMTIKISIQERLFREQRFSAFQEATTGANLFPFSQIVHKQQQQNRFEMFIEKIYPLGKPV